MLFYSCKIETPIGTLLAVASDNYLVLLDFLDSEKLDTKLKKIGIGDNGVILEADNSILITLKKQLEEYFLGKLKSFNISTKNFGSNFQVKAWEILQIIPFGKTISYKEQATELGNSKSFRAVANANGKNLISIIIPCHRVINTNGGLGGYASGVDRKRWLIEHESKFA